MPDGRDIGCIAKLESFFSAETGLFCGVWIGIWFYMILQLCAVRHTGQIRKKYDIISIISSKILANKFLDPKFFSHFLIFQG